MDMCVLQVFGAKREKRTGLDERLTRVGERMMSVSVFRLFDMDTFASWKYNMYKVV